MIDPKINTLLTLVSVGNYTKTADLLSLTQPAVSHHIKSLEELYGIKIFHNTRKKLTLTAQGEILLKYASRIASLEESAKREIFDSHRNVQRFNVGITTTLAEYLVSPIFVEYCNNNPGKHINIVTDNIENIYSMLSAYQLDWAIVEGRIPRENYTSILLDTDHLVLVVSPQHRLATRTSVSLQELKQEKFILRSENAGTRTLFENHLLSLSEDIANFNIVIETNNIKTIKELVISNLGVTIIAHSAIRDKIEQGRLVVVPIENLNMVREINMVYHQDFPHSEILEDIREIYLKKHK